MLSDLACAIEEFLAECDERVFDLILRVMEKALSTIYPYPRPLPLRL